MFAGLLCFIAVNAVLIAGRNSGKHANGIASLSEMSSPLYFFADGAESKAVKPVQATEEFKIPTIVNHASKETLPVKEENKKKYEELPRVVVHNDIPAGPYTYVNFIETIAPKVRELKSYQEEQVKEALEASRKVLEEKQWKDVEKRIADAMTSSEKDALKSQYEKQLSKVDWSKMKAKLSMAYDNIDWNKVNENLNNALTEIRIDSLHQVYTNAMADLTILQKELCENNLKGIPDSDISVESVEQKKKDVQKVINTLNKVKTRKIVHL